MKAKKLGLLLLSGALALSMVACNSGNQGGGSSSTASTGSTASTASTASKDDGNGEAVEPIHYHFLHCWNGGAGDYPDGWNNGQVSQYITEKTGVILDVETIVSSETEKCAMMFASGDVPDITNGPYWSTNPGGEGEQIKNAGRDGLLLDLNPYMDQFPNVKAAMTENINGIFLERHLEHPDFNGARYIIPNKPKTDEDITNWAYGVFARGDILESLGVKSTDITNENQLYDLLVKIKNGGFTDINGREVIPAGNWHNGWSWQQYVLSFYPGTITDWQIIDGTPVHLDMSQNMTDMLLYMRKLISEGLYDAEALTQTDTMGKEKMSTGRVATFGCHWPNHNGFFQSTLYLTNPEMEYQTLGPFIRRNGTPATTVSRKGAYGFGCLFLSADIKEPERALGAIDFMSSEEGLLLRNFGLEGVHYDMVDGVPTLKEDWKKIKVEDPQTWKLEGIGWGNIGTEDALKSKGWDADYSLPGFVYAREVRPLEFYEGENLNDISEAWPGRAAYDEKMSTVNWGDQQKVIITAASDEEAIQMIEDYRKKMIDAGYNEMVEYLKEQLAANPDIVV